MCPMVFRKTVILRVVWSDVTARGVSDMRCHRRNKAHTTNGVGEQIDKDLQNTLWVYPR